MFQKAEKLSAVEQMVRDAEAVIEDYIGHSTAEAKAAIEQHCSGEVKPVQSAEGSSSFVDYAKKGVSFFSWGYKTVKETASAVFTDEQLSAERMQKAQECFVELKELEDGEAKYQRLIKLLVDNMALSSRYEKDLDNGSLHTKLRDALCMTQFQAEKLVPITLSKSKATEPTEEDSKAEVVEKGGPII